jgi:hypothetical protein
LFGGFETQIAERLPTIIEHARDKQLSNGDLDTLAYMMALQRMRTERFRKMIQSFEADALKWVLQTTSQFPSAVAEMRKLADEKGLELTPELLEQTQQFFADGNYTIETDNTTHLKFLMSQERLEGFHNLFLSKQWNILKADKQYRFVTSDNPVAEWMPERTSPYGATFLQRKHYFPLTPDIMIESLNPPEEMRRKPPAEFVVYRECTDDDVLLFNMVIAQHSNDFLYSQQKAEFTELLRQLHTPGAAMQTYMKEYFHKDYRPQAPSATEHEN